MGQQVVTVSKAEEAATEEAACEALVDEGFVPAAPLTSAPPVYSGATTYGLGAIVEETGHGYFRSQKAANKAHTPHEDTDFEWWAPVAVGAIVPLQNPDYLHTQGVLTERGFESQAPARSDALAAPSETIAPGAEIQDAD